MTNDDYTIKVYQTEWTEFINIVIMLYDPICKVQCGIVEVRVYRGENEHAGEALIWNLQIQAGHRGQGLGKQLLRDAEYAAMRNGATVAVIEWDHRDSHYWVYEWYIRHGYDEKEFGNGYSLMKRKLNPDKL